MNSHYNIQYDDEGLIVYFDIDIVELFGVDLNTTGVKSALNQAFQSARKVIPYRTGLMRRSFTMIKVSSDKKVRCYFDPKKILGVKRLGKIVTEYYPRYLIQYAKRYNWLDLVILRFLTTLELEMLKLAKTNKEIDTVNFGKFMSTFRKKQRAKIKEEKRMRELEAKQKEELKQKKETLINSIKKGGK